MYVGLDIGLIYIIKFIWVYMSLYIGLTYDIYIISTAWLYSQVYFWAVHVFAFVFIFVILL